MAFDPEAATAAYIDGLGPEALSKAAAYTSGAHWLLLWGLVITALASWLIIRWGVLSTVSTKLAGRGFALRTWLVCTLFLLISSLLSLPWSIYANWWREAAYGRTSQPLGDFLAQGLISIVITALLGGLVLSRHLCADPARGVALVAVVRRARGPGDFGRTVDRPYRHRTSVQ